MVYHHDAIEAGKLHISVHDEPKQSLPYQISKVNQEQFEKNSHILECIVKVLLLCGKQNLALRGHRDDSTSTESNKGNFLAVLNLMSESDKILQDHIQSCKGNATYTSKTIQNELIGIIGDHIRSEITQTLQKDGSVFSVIGDEVSSFC